MSVKRYSMWWCNAQQAIPFDQIDGDDVPVRANVVLASDYDNDMRHASEHAAALRDSVLAWEATADRHAHALAVERGKLEKADAFKSAVREALIVNCIYRDEHEDNPEAAVAELIEWEQKIALDPAVSSEAAALRDTYLAENQRLVERVRELETMARSQRKCLSAIRQGHPDIGHMLAELHRAILRFTNADT